MVLESPNAAPKQELYNIHYSINTQQQVPLLHFQLQSGSKSQLVRQASDIIGHHLTKD